MSGYASDDCLRWRRLISRSTASRIRSERFSPVSSTESMRASVPGRIVAVSGKIDVGAIFSPFAEGRWRWRIFVDGPSAAASMVGHYGEAKTELAAKTALDHAWANFLVRADLVEREPASEAQHD